MAEDQPRLELQFRILGPEPISPTDFVDLFRCAESFARSITEQETLALLEDIGISGEYRLAVVQRLHSIGRRVPVPAEVDRVTRGSWVIVLTIAGSALLFMLKQYIHPTVKEAWDESELRDRFRRFMRDDVFRGAKRTAEQKAVQAPTWGNLRVQSVETVDSAPHEAPKTIQVTLERRTIVEVRASDKQLLDEFIQRLRG